MGEQISGDTMRLDCPAPRLPCRTVLSTLVEKALPAGEVLDTASPSPGTGCGEVPAPSKRRGSAASRICVSILFLIALVATCLPVQAADTKMGNDSVQAVLDRVKKMSPAEQQAWLGQLEQRAAKAARLTMSAEDAAKYEKRTQAMLHQETVTWKVLREVVGDTETRETAIKTAEAVKAQAAEIAKNAKEALAKTPVVVKREAKKVVVPELKTPVVKEEPKKIEPKKAEVAKPQTAAKDVVKPAVVKEEPKRDVAKPQAAVTVNVEELDARIAGCNLMLRELEAALAEKDVAWEAAKLEPLSDRLKELVVRYNDLSLVRGAVPKPQQATVTPLESPKSLISQFSVRVVEARKRAKDPKNIDDDVEREAELTRLDAVSHRLAELAGK